MRADVGLWALTALSLAVALAALVVALARPAQAPAVVLQPYDDADLRRAIEHVQRRVDVQGDSLDLLIDLTKKDR